MSKKKQIYIPDNKNIPNFNISSLHIHTRQRKLTPKDLLDNTVILIHDGPKIAFQCVTDTSLDLDGIPYACSPTSFDWFTPPTTVTNLATGHSILNVEKLKTVHARWTLENLNSPIPVQKLLIRPPLPHLSKRIINYFNKTDPIRASLVSGTTLLIILFLALPCAFKICCPSSIPSCCPNISCHNEEQSKKKASKKTDKLLRQKAKQYEFARSVKHDLPSAPEIEAKIQLLHNNIYNQ